jgi:hypothetical protein
MRRASATLAAFLTTVLGAVRAEAQTFWPAHSPARGLETRTDAHGHRTAAALGHTPTAPTLKSHQPANWQSLGPFGGDIADVQASPANASIVLAGLAPSSGSGGGLYRSTNAGASWSAVNALAGRSVYDIAFAPDGTAYIATIDAVWKSVNDGASWTQLNLAIGLNDQVLAVEIDPSDPLRVWAGVGDALGGQPVNVMLSINGGVSWTNKTPPLGSPMTCTGIAVHPADSNRIYACFGGFLGGGQVWVSANGGTTWVNRSAGLPNNPMNDIVHDGSRVLLGGGQLFGSQFVGLYASANEGVTWSALHDGTWPNLVVHDIGIDPNDASRLYVGTAGQGLFGSTDGGSSWSFQAGGTGSLSVNAVSFSPGSSSVIYTGSSSNAVWKSTDSGASFAPSSSGIGALDVFSIASNPNNANELAIAFQGLNDGGVYTSLDGGASWSLAALPATRFSTVRFAPSTGQLYAISVGPTSIAPEGLYRRTGASWSGIGPDQGSLFESELFAMRVSRNDPNLIVAAGSDFGVAGFEPTVWRTVNGGTTWTKTYEGTVSKPFQDLHIVDEFTDTTLLAVYVDYNSQNGGVLRSTNGGVTWLPSNSGLPAVVQPFSLAVSPTSASTLYISNNASPGGNGVFRSVDAGQNWTATGFVGQAFEVQTGRTNPNVLYISQFNAPKVRISTNGGLSFTPYDAGLAGVGSPRDLQRATGFGSSLLLATTTGSYSTDL